MLTILAPATHCWCLPSNSMCPQGTESTCQWRQRLSWYFLQCPSCDTHQMPLKSLQVHKVQICQDDTPSSSPVAPITRWTLLAGLPWLPGWDEEQLGYSQRWHLRRDGTHLATPGTTGAVDALLFAAPPALVIPSASYTSRTQGKKPAILVHVLDIKKTAFKNKMGIHHELSGWR